MGTFTTSGRRYAEGTLFPAFGNTDQIIPAASSGVSTTQQAPQALPDGGVNREFLFWDTGRRLTSVRTVRWTFNNPGNWTSWNAVAWYGPPGGGPPNPTVGFNAFQVGSGPMDPTPVDGPGSTFVNGPDGQLAWPYEGDEHEVRTEWGAEVVRALATLVSGGGATLDFSSLMWLVPGGDDDDGVFQETDDGIPPGSTSIPGIASTTAQQLALPEGSGGAVLAGYVVPVSPVVHPPRFIDQLIALVRTLNIPINNGDPSPDDVIRLKLIAESLDLVRGEVPKGDDAFDGLVEAANRMSAAELKRTIAGTRATLQRGEAALKTMEGLESRQGKAGG
jgi:hypothetical protein